MKLLEIVHLGFENAPEALHGAVVNAAAWTGHALRCMDSIQLRFKLPDGILKAPVTVKQGMGARVGVHRRIKGVKTS